MVATCTAYLLIAAAVVLLRVHRTHDRASALDTLITCLGLGLISFVALHLALPNGSASLTYPQAAGGLYPYGDLVILLFVSNAARSAYRRSLSVWLFIGCLVWLVLGNLSLMQTNTATTPATPALGWVRVPAPAGLEWVNHALNQTSLCYALAGICAILAALHPSITGVSHRTTSTEDHAWSLRRLTALVPCLLSPFVALFIDGSRQNPAVLTAISVAGIAMIAALLVRATYSVRSYARTEHVFRHQARHDALTGLANRRLLEEHITGLLAQTAAPTTAQQQSHLWLLFLDLDGFKAVNDTWGHDVGDELLVDVAARLHLCLEEATVISRIGGDEFVVAVRGDANTGPRLARRILGVFGAPFRLSTGQVNISPSIGVARGHQHSSAAELIREADEAMYQAKSTGRNRWVVFEASTTSNSCLHPQRIDQSIRTAIAQGHLRLEYQPVVLLNSSTVTCTATPTTQVVGVQALVRWHHPVLGHISPEQYLPSLETSGVNTELGLWSLTTALTHLASWRAAHMVQPDFYVSVSLTTRQLQAPQLVHQLRQLLQRTAVAAQCLQVQLSQVGLNDPSHPSGPVLRELHQLGVRLSVRHTSSHTLALGYLQHHPIDHISVDPATLSPHVSQQAQQARTPQQVVRAMVALCQQLGVGVGATEVETQDHENCLRRLGITYAQGWRYVADFSALGQRAPLLPQQSQANSSEQTAAQLAVHIGS